MSLNKAILMGRLTADPEMRRTQSGTAVCSFTLAVNRQKRDDPADFIEIVAWQSTAEFVCHWFKKGMQVAVCGRIQTRTWEDKQGQKRKSVEVVAESVDFAESRSKGAGVAVDAGDFMQADDGDDLPF